MATWVVVLIKDFDSAKQRLRPALGPKERRALAQRNAQLAVQAAAAGDRILVVAGDDEVAELAKAWGAEVLLEPSQEGQNVAAARGIARTVEGGADAVLLLSSDLPLVTVDSVREVLDAGSRIKGPVAVAVRALARGGTHPLCLSSPGAITAPFAAAELS